MPNVLKKLIIVLLFINSSSVFASDQAVKDLVDEFPTYQGENGFYAEYHYSYPIDPTPYYQMNQDEQNPLKYTSIGLLFSTVEKIDDKILLKPAESSSGFGGWDAIYSWVAQDPGTYRITGKFKGISNASKVAIYIDDKENSPVFVKYLTYQNNDGLFDLTLTLNTNQKVRFAAFSLTDTLRGTIVSLSGTIVKDEIDIANYFPTYQGENGFYAEYHYSYPIDPQPYYNMQKDSQSDYKYKSIGVVFSTVEKSSNKIILRPASSSSGFGGWDSIYSWTSIESGSYHVKGMFKNISNISKVAIYVDDAENDPCFVKKMTFTNNDGFFDIVLNLNKNQKVRFVVFCESDTLPGTVVELTGKISRR